jgi:hypothetical protein
MPPRSNKQGFPSRNGIFCPDTTFCGLKSAGCAYPGLSGLNWKLTLVRIRLKAICGWAQG